MEKEKKGKVKGGKKGGIRGSEGKGDEREGERRKERWNKRERVRRRKGEMVYWVKGIFCGICFSYPLWSSFSGDASKGRRSGIAD